MEPWETDDDQFYEDGDGEPSAIPVAFVSTQQSVPLVVDEVEDHRTPEGMVCMGTFFNKRLIARSIIPPEALNELETQSIFASPVRLGLAAIEQDPGLQCRLFALLPTDQFAAPEPEEPWAASVPKFEDLEAELEGEEDTVVPILLGHIVRFQKDRKHPESLAAEAADVLRAILSDDRPLSSVVDKILEDL
ncbi:MAG: hypothetical protein ACE5HT_16150 [Gemmatimonadales bacterium]